MPKPFKPFDVIRTTRARERIALGCFIQYIDVDDALDLKGAAAAGVDHGNFLWVRLRGASLRPVEISCLHSPSILRQDEWVALWEPPSSIRTKGLGWTPHVRSRIDTST